MLLVLNPVRRLTKQPLAKPSYWFALVNRKHLQSDAHRQPFYWRLRGPLLSICVTCVVLLTFSTLVLLTLKKSNSNMIFLPWLCAGSTSSVRDMRWRSAGSRLPCLWAWEPSWRCSGFFWRRNWTSWAPESLRQPWSWNKTASHFHPTQALYVISGRVFPSFVLFLALIIISSVCQPGLKKCFAYWLRKQSQAKRKKINDVGCHGKWYQNGSWYEGEVVASIFSKIEFISCSSSLVLWTVPGHSKWSQCCS